MSAESYPDYNVLDRMEFWDDHTRQIVESRLSSVPQPAFFTKEEAATLRAAVLRLLPQQRETPIPVMPFIDEKLAKNRTDGTQYVDMPPMQELWRMFIRSLDEEAAHTYNKQNFAGLDGEAQDTVLRALEKGESRSSTWGRVPAKRSFQQIISIAAMFYYAHPEAWNEVGWGGPKHPERYVRIECGRKDPEEPGRVGENWPINYNDLEPYYAEVEKFNQVSGPTFFPWGAYHGPYPKRSHYRACMHETFRRGCEALGIPSTVGPMFILSSATKDRPGCTYRGFCKFGCMPKSKSSTLVTYVPHALKYGAKIIPNAMVVRLNIGKDGTVRSVTYLSEGNEREQEGDTFIVSAYSIETPRLLLNSKSEQFPEGIANSSGMVGKNLMVHSADFVIGKYEEMIRQYRGPQGLALTQEWYTRKPGDGFVRGYTIETETLQPIEFSQALIKGKGVWGRQLIEDMRDYNHYVSFGIVGECLPSENSTVTLTVEALAARTADYIIDAKQRFEL